MIRVESVSSRRRHLHPHARAHGLHPPVPVPPPGVGVDLKGQPVDAPTLEEVRQDLQGSPADHEQFCLVAAAEGAVQVEQALEQESAGSLL